MVLLSWLFFGEKKPAPPVFAGILLGLGGVTALVGGGLSGVAAFPLFDAFLVLVAALAWSWGSLYCRRAELPKSSFLSIAMPLILGGLLLSLMGLAT